MKPYSPKRHTKGIAGRRRSCDTPHRKRCLRVDKKAARRESQKMGVRHHYETDMETFEWEQSDWGSS